MNETNCNTCKKVRKLSLKDLEKFYKSYSRAIREHCKLHGIKKTDLEVSVDADSPGKITFSYNGKTFLQAECNLIPFTKFRRYKPSINENKNEL